MVVATNDEMEDASNDVTSEVSKMIDKPKKLFEIDSGHFGLLHYPSSIFDKSSQAQIDFLNKHFKQE
jgi:phage pi2 protein 07